jgi:heme exporter protein B
MMIIQEIKTLIGKEIRLELKNKYMLNGILLYVLSTVFVTVMAFDSRITPQTWNSLFWIILLFVAVNGIGKSFLQESPGRYLYYYTVASPQSIILSKIIYNLVLMALLAILSWGLFVIMIGNPMINTGLFLSALFLGSIGLSSVLTMVAAIASRAGSSFSLIAILSFPIVLPLLITLIKVSKNALDSPAWTGNLHYLIILIIIDIIVVFLAYLLFPYLWRD